MTSSTFDLPSAIAALARVPCFAPLSEATLTTLANESRYLSWPAKTRLGSLGDAPKSIWVLLTGKARVFHETGDHQVTVKHLMAPCTVFEKEVIAECPIEDCVETLVPSSAFEIPAKRFRAVIRETPDAAWNLLLDVSQRFCLAARNERVLLAEPEARLASVLMAMIEWFGREGASGTRIQLPLTQKDLADHTGVSLRTMSRLLRGWSESNIVSRHKGWIVINDVTRLTELSRGLRHNLNYPGFGNTDRSLAHASTSRAPNTSPSRHLAHTEERGADDALNESAVDST